MSESPICYRVLHDYANCRDHFRVESAKRSIDIVSAFATELELKSFFPRSLDELNEAISTLPFEFENILPNSSIGEETFLVTSNRVFTVLELWKKVYALTGSYDTENPYPLSQVKLFAIHLHLWMMLEAFLKSDFTHLIYLEDDIHVPENFQEEAFRLLSVLPSDWDFFNFVIPEEELHRHKPHLDLPGLDVCINYQRYPGACLLISRKGARKLLSHFLLEAEQMPLNIDLSAAFDVTLANCSHPPEHNFQIWFLNQSPRHRKFQTYTYVPQSNKAVGWRNFHSSWR